MRKLYFVIARAGLIILFVAAGFFIGKLIPQSIPNASAQTATPTLTPTPTTSSGCTTPSQVQNVSLSFPYCNNGTQVGSTCDDTQANCTWTANSGATNYQVTITNATTNTQVSSQQIAAGTTNLAFPVTNNDTYTCTVAAVNSCGTSGPTSSYSLLCAVNGLDTATPAPTTPPTSTPVPTIKPTGSIGNTIMVGLAAAGFVIGGLFLVFI